MITIKDYVFPKTIEEGYNFLVSKKNTVLFGGGAYIRMGSKNIPLAIDLSKAGLDYIKEEDSTIEIGAMTTFGDIERSDLLKSFLGGILPESVKEIVGVQFRNIATVGGTVYSRYGFSDLITALLSLNTSVKLYKGGILPLEDFLRAGTKERDLLESIIITKSSGTGVFKSMRNSKGDYAMLNVAVSKVDSKYRIAVGARPGRGILAYEAMQYLNTIEYLNSRKLTEEAIEMAGELVADELIFGTNTRGSREYRRKIAKVLVKRALKEVARDEY